MNVFIKTDFLQNKYNIFVNVCQKVFWGGLSDILKIYIIYIEKIVMSVQHTVWGLDFLIVRNTYLTPKNKLCGTFKVFLVYLY